MQISYIIATYAGKDHTSNKDLSELVLHLKIQQFIQLLKNKIFNKVDNHIQEVVIVCPHVEKDNLLPTYYRSVVWRSQLDVYGVNLKMVELYRRQSTSFI